jgi:ribokinase
VIDVIGFGAINLDEIYSVRSLSALAVRGAEMPPGSEQAIDDGQYEELTRWLEAEGMLRATSGGGQAANTVYALSALGGFRTAIIGSVGADEDGDSLLAGLAPVDTSEVARGGPTTKCAVLVDKHGERTICVLLTPPEASLPDPVAACKRLGWPRYLHLTSLTHTEELDAQVKLVKAIPGHVKVSFDPGELYCRLGAKPLAPILERTSVLFLGEREAELLTGKSPSQACEDILSLGPSIVVCKKGAQGVDVLTADGQHFSVTAKKVAVVDPTGAGDVFAAGFLAGLLMGLDLQRCAALGTEAAAQSVTGYGRSSYPGPGFLASMGLRTSASSHREGGSPT